MKIELTRKQYDDLLKLVYLGDWMINSHRNGNALEEYEELAGHIYSFAEAFGNREDVEFYEETSSFSPTESLADKCDGYISKYDEYNFWNELENGLAWRDLRNQLGTQQIEQMETTQLIERFVPIQTRYIEEFEKNRLDNLHLVKGDRIVR